MAIWKTGNTDLSRPLVERILRTRGVGEPASFLNPDFASGLHDPGSLAGMDSAVSRVVRALRGRETVVIAGDYDADGVCASAFLFRFFREFGTGKTEVLLPHRLRDGFGLNRSMVDRAREIGTTLIITVDNGITAADAVAFAADNGMDVVVTDHHSMTGDFPERAVAVLDPAVPGQEYPFPALSGAGVAWKLADAVLRELVLSDVGTGNRVTEERRESFLKWNLDLIALATIADVVELTDENRVLVRYGLQVLNRSRNMGIRELCRFSRSERVNAETVAFRIGPRINAAGRLDDARLAFDLLVSEDEEAAGRLAEKIETLNSQRQGLVRRAVSEAAGMAEKQLADGERVLIVENGGWHPGIIGLISGRLSEQFNHPVLAFTKAGDGDGWVASCRSVPGFDLREMLGRFSGYFLRSGGHALAAGLTVPDEKMALFREELFSWGREVLSGIDLETELVIDTLALPAEMSMENCRALLDMEPFGQGNREPNLLFEGIPLMESRRVGGDGAHFRFTVRGGSGEIAGIGFGMGGLADLFPSGSRVDLVANLRINEFRGQESPQLVLRDMRGTATV